MVSASRAEVSSQALIELQSNLIALSENLNELYNTLHDNKSKLSEEWRDEKYDEFAEEFEQSEKLISELSGKYAEWANKYLPPRIESVMEIEKASGTLGSGSVGSNSSAPNAGEFSAGAETSTSGKTAEFRRGIERIKAKMNIESIPPSGGPKSGSCAPDSGVGGFGQNERERLWWIMNQKMR